MERHQVALQEKLARIIVVMRQDVLDTILEQERAQLLKDRVILL